ncbi:NACHT, LRR and PYD domains-containing protein 5 [Erinaceus europaeus]|uniref:NACHT, LRR and PYD domains-containing protein 5 n=1 Tax=Erinaceus europaeus TaxID=9365 RepID=A0A1S3APP3_ERIEU|nr:NACHT, LRR and PYD domains-containing protein 5 [Erinaceus europaeus]
MKEAVPSPFSRCGMLWCFQQLSHEEFQTFKHLLRESKAALRLPQTFTWEDVQNAHAEKLASILHQQCPASLVWATASSILEQMNLSLLTEVAREKMKSLEEKQSQYKIHMMSKFATKLEGQQDLTQLACDILEKEVLAAAFSPELSGFRPHTVVLHGMPSCGEWALARAVQLCWLQGELYQDLFSYVLLLRLGALQPSEESSLAELLCAEWPGAPLPDILAQPELMLLVVDGLDGLADALGEEAEARAGCMCTDWTERVPVWVLLRELLCKALLPKCSLLLTVGDGALPALGPWLQAPRFLWAGQLCAGQLEEQPQTEPGAAEGVSAECAPASQVPGAPQNQALGGQTPATQAIWSLGEWTPARQALWRLGRGLALSRLWLGASEQQRLSADKGAKLVALCRLAAAGLQAGRLELPREMVQARGLSPEHLQDLLGTQVLVPQRSPEGVSTFSFPPGLQPLLTALHFVLDEVEPLRDPDPQLLGVNAQPLDPHCHVDHLLPMVRFLYSLMNEEATQTLETVLGRPLSPRVRWDLQHCVSLLGHRAAAHTDVLEAFYCLFETQNPNFVRSALSGFQELWQTLLLPADLHVVAFCLQHCPHLSKLRLEVRVFYPLDVTNRISRLQKNSVAESWEKLCSMFGTNSELHQLDLSSSILTEGAMKVLCAKLCQATCKIQKLTFKYAQIPLGLNCLWMTLISNHNIKHLDLQGTPLLYEDVQMACEALKHPSCVLESLRLDSCGLTEDCCSLISQVITGSPSLHFLSLAGNNLLAKGLKLLFTSLQASQCCLQRLGLGSCDLQASACQDLTFGLSKNLSLTHLSLSDNKLGSNGMNLLCLSICLPSCPLQRLTLNECDLDETTCGLLAIALQGKSHLTHLSLSVNPLGDGGVTLLCASLKTPCCHLQDLELVRCDLTEACCEKLSCVITENKRLKSLDLGGNALGDAGVLALCKGLRQEHSSLRRLGLEACGLTAECCEALADSQHLTSLNLLHNDLGEAGLKRLCEAFACSTCSLQRLGLCVWQNPAPMQKLLDKLQQLRPQLEMGEDWYTWGQEDRFWWRY